MAGHAEVRELVQALRSQQGGAIEIYRPYGQSGEGFGDILRGIGRFFLPLFAKGAATFFGEVSRGQDEGKGFGEAAKSALLPTAGSVIAGATSALTRSQSGRGVKRGRKRRKAMKKALAMVGSGRRRRTTRKVYKGGKRTRKSHPKSRRRVKKFKFNF